MSPRLLQISGVVVDLLYQVEAVPAPGEEAIVTGFSIEPSGGFNAMVAAKRTGMDAAVRLCASLQRVLPGHSGLA